MSDDFKKRLFFQLPSIVTRFKEDSAGSYDDSDIDPELSWTLSSGFHVYDELGIRQTIESMKELFFTKHPGKNFFAVKACPNIHILKIMLEMGFGLDCASPTEIYRAKKAGAGHGDIMYTSNNTHPDFYQYALDSDVILNLDDISFLDKVPEVPKRICFRYNPGDLRQEGTDEIIGTPVNQKYGVRYDQIVEAYKRARDLGAEIFGIHTMYASNQLNPRILAGNAKMQLEVVEKVQDTLGIEFEFINIGGGLGINYTPEEAPLDINLMAELVNYELDEFKACHGYLPKLYLESGRYVTGPHGALVSRAINIMDKYKKFVGVDICDAADILRASIYPKYHGVSVVTPAGKEKDDRWPRETVSIVGPLCENMHMISDRELPVIHEGDFVVIHDTGAHGIAMSMKYNGWGCSPELLLDMDGHVRRISRGETISDLVQREISPSCTQRHGHRNLGGKEVEEEIIKANN